MSQVQGVVEQVSQRGKATNIKVNGAWFGAGFNGVPCQQGDTVSFTVEQNGQYANVARNSLQVINGGGAPQQPQQQPYQAPAQTYAKPQRRQAPTSGGGGVTKDDYWKNREERDVETQKRIQLQASRNSAIATASAALAAGILPVPAKKADAFDAFVAVIDELTERYNNQTSGEEAVEANAPTSA